MSESTAPETAEVTEPEEVATSTDETTEEPTVKGDGTTVKPDNYNTP
ncbi:hypothetical protein ACFXJ5_11720 [Streptomyces sp. NPDC059373]